MAFGNTLNDMLGNRIVLGIKESHTQSEVHECQLIKIHTIIGGTTGHSTT